MNLQKLMGSDQSLERGLYMQEINMEAKIMRETVKKILEEENQLPNMNKLYFARDSKDVILPSKDSENGGFDIYAYFDEDEFIIQPHETRLVPTGLHSAFTEDYVLLGRERGSTGSIGMKVSAGVIDSGYRGQIFIAIINSNSVPIVISKLIKNKEITKDAIFYPYAKGIAQLILVPIPKVTVEEISVEKLQAIPSKRGNGQLGSSNK